MLPESSDVLFLPHATLPLPLHLSRVFVGKLLHALKMRPVGVPGCDFFLKRLKYTLGFNIYYSRLVGLSTHLALSSKKKL